MSGLGSLIRLNVALLMRRRLPLWIAGTALIATALTTATAGVEDGQGARAVASAARFLAATLVGLMAVMGAVTVSGDAASGALRAVMIRPVSRSAVVVAPPTPTAALGAAIYLLGILLAWVIAAAAFGFGDVTYSIGDFEQVMIPKAELAGFQTRLLLLAVPGLLVPPLIALCISVNTDDTATAVVLALVATLGPLLFGLITGEVPGWVFTESALGPLGALKQLSEGIELQRDTVQSTGYLWRSIWQPATWAAVCLALSLITFRRREIHS